ncbi:hypothetical protein LAV73_09435 [Lysinibacillus xylanilyticus]|uniref:hypothetical protein n=1 Tax=Lysinibacillus xylanilyticus TaxID=582475 RepID=UPI002B24A61E|nr:hypothetical protein [Lysinibacillus xylanilyticus]MEB2280216.1 hypothetical protein [Lysinibacillus xylanilyticus]
MGWNWIFIPSFFISRYNEKKNRFAMACIGDRRECSIQKFMLGKVREYFMERKDNFYFFTGTKEDLYSYNVLFQGKSSSLIELDIYYMKQIEKWHNKEIGSEIEVLPSIYYRKIKSEQPKNVFSKTLNFIYSQLFDKQKFNIVIEVRNIRDSFKIVKDDIEHEYNCYVDAEYIEENLYIDTKELPYPNSLGGGPNRCDIWGIFSRLKLLDYRDDLYNILDNKRMFELSSCNDRLLEVCINSKHCGKIIKKMKEGKYKAKFEVDNNYYDDDISVELQDGTYRLNEGKHRVCMAKRFNIERIPAQVTTIISDKDTLVKPKRFFHSKPLNCENILIDCYDKYNRLGLSNDSVRELNETVSDMELVNFIETTVGKTLTEIERELLGGILDNPPSS